jgi:hypothetical protein
LHQAQQSIDFRFEPYPKKNQNNMTWNSIMGFVSTLALFLPIFLILVLRLGSYRSFPVLLIYFTIVFINNLMNEQFIQPNTNVVLFWGISTNLLDAPLMLLFLSYFSTSAAFSRRLVIFIILFLIFELTVVLLVGFNVSTVTIVLGPGILSVLAVCLLVFIRQSKIVITSRKAIGKTLIAASLVFAYGSYGFLYVLFYVVKTPLVADTFLLYFMVVTLSSTILCAGIIFERKRIQKLFELKKARKELHDIYKDTKPATSYRTAMLDFDSEPWN